MSDDMRAVRYDEATRGLANMWRQYGPARNGGPEVSVVIFVEPPR